jgi:hypothetical protein
LQQAIDFYALSARDENTAEVGFLDMGACIMTLSDNSGERMWGRPWLLIAALPLPRQFWPDKPPVNDYLRELSTVERPMYTMGMTPLLFGDAYLNFGPAGVVFWPLIVAYLMGRVHRSAIMHPHLSPARLFYLTLLATSLQLYRDCLAQAILFPTTTFLPLIVVASLQVLINKLRLKSRAAATRVLRPALSGGAA